jgi:hypothetical protein
VVDRHRLSAVTPREGLINVGSRSEDPITESSGIQGMAAPDSSQPHSSPWSTNSVVICECFLLTSSQPLRLVPPLRSLALRNKHSSSIASHHHHCPTARCNLTQHGSASCRRDPPVRPTLWTYPCTELGRSKLMIVRTPCTTVHCTN